jgi:hypothetical protein
MKHRLYVMIDPDDVYELPLAVCETQEELAAAAGMKPKSVKSALSKIRRGKYKHPRFVEVEI